MPNSTPALWQDVLNSEKFAVCAEAVDKIESNIKRKFQLKNESGEIKATEIAVTSSWPKLENLLLDSVNELRKIVVDFFNKKNSKSEEWHKIEYAIQATAAFVTREAEENLKTMDIHIKTLQKTRCRDIAISLMIIGFLTLALQVYAGFYDMPLQWLIDPAITELVSKIAIITGAVSLASFILNVDHDTQPPEYNVLKKLSSNIAKCGLFSGAAWLTIQKSYLQQTAQSITEDSTAAVIKSSALTAVTAITTAL